MNSEDLPTLISVLPDEDRQAYRQLPLFIQLIRRIGKETTANTHEEHLPLAIDEYGLQDTAVYIMPRPICKIDFSDYPLE